MRLAPHPQFCKHLWGSVRSCHLLLWFLLYSVHASVSSQLLAFGDKQTSLMYPSKPQSTANPRWLFLTDFFWRCGHNRAHSVTKQESTSNAKFLRKLGHPLTRSFSVLLRPQAADRVFHPSCPIPEPLPPPLFSRSQSCAVPSCPLLYYDT